MEENEVAHRPSRISDETARMEPRALRQPATAKKDKMNEVTT
jgi:hypothetical protein